MVKKSNILYVVAGDKGSVAYLVKKLSTSLQNDFTTLVYNIKSKDSIIRLYRAIKISDIIHLHSAIPIGIAWFIRLINRNALIVGSFHDLGRPYFKFTLPRIKRVILSYFFDFGIKYLDHTIFVSNSQLSFYLVNGYHLSNPIVIPNSFQVLNDLKFHGSERSKNLAFIGGPFMAKGYDFILNIIGSLGDYTLHFFGLSLSQIPKKYKEMCKVYMGNSMLNLYSYMDQRKMYEYIINLGYIVVIPSYGEGLPLTALECSSLQIPLIVNDLGVYNEFLPKEVVPRFKTGNLESFNKALSDLDSISELSYKVLSSKIKEQFKLEAYIDRHNNFYKLITS